jgi:hypothetical protein
MSNQKLNDMVEVMRIGDMGVLAVAEAMLGGEGIEYLVTNTAMINLFPADGFTSELVRILVNAEDESDARRILENIVDHPEATPTPDETEQTDS